jgi:hypothetical protein
MGITSSSVLTELNISVWTGQKLDRSATDKVTSDNNAVRDAGQFKKNLMAGTGARKEIADYAASCRLWHNTRTLPWADKGARLLPTSLFLAYKDEANARRAYFDNMVDKFMANYQSHVHTARQNLGALFDPADYPSEDEVRSKFGFRLVFSPVPESGDFRLDLPKQDMEEMAQSYEHAFNDRLADAMRTPWEQLHKMLTAMSSKLTESDDDTKKRWHDTFLTNAQDMCMMLTHLNITKDAKLEQARQDLQRALVGVDIDDIKEDADVREDVKAKLDAILSANSW